MENLSLHIEYLLLRHDCVVVPGFGAFINVHHAARFDSDSCLWLPPMREVRFNGAINHDDGLLAGSFARKTRLSFPEGRNLLAREISALRAALAADGEVTLGQLGTLRQVDDAISFHPAFPATYYSETLGYMPAPIRPVAADTAPDTADASTTGRRFNTDRNYYIPVNKIFARTAACLMLVAVVAISIVMPMSERQHVDKASVVPVEKVMNITAGRQPAEAKVDATQQAEAEVDATQQAEAEVDATQQAEAKVESEPEILAAPTAEYHAVVATFTKEEAARQFVEIHKNCGFTLSIINTATKCRVSAAEGATADEVRTAMRQPGFRSQFSEAWIWQHK